MPSNPLNLLVPTLVIILTILYIPFTAIILLTNLTLRPFSSPTLFQRAWFAHFWNFFGYVSKPLFRRDIESILPQAYGVVLDVGCGAGDWIYLFSPSRNPNVKKVLLLEPNTHFHDMLRRKAEKAGLGGKYEILSGGVEDLQRMGVKEGSVDTVSTVHVLCSVPAVEGCVGGLYKVLKPGGQWLVYEHVRVRPEKSVPGVCQSMANIFWPFFLDGCSLRRDTEDLLRHVGKWESVDLRPGVNQGQWEQLPHIRGRLVKEGWDGTE